MREIIDVEELMIALNLKKIENAGRNFKCIANVEENKIDNQKIQLIDSETVGLNMAIDEINKIVKKNKKGREFMKTFLKNKKCLKGE